MKLGRDAQNRSYKPVTSDSGRALLLMFAFWEASSTKNKGFTVQDIEAKTKRTKSLQRREGKLIGGQEGS